MRLWRSVIRHRTVRCAGLMLALAPAWSAAAAQDWLITQTDGAASVLQGRDRVAAVAGLPVGPGAILETGAGTTLLRLESPAHAAIDLGPLTRVLLGPPGFAAPGSPPPVLYLLGGWVKLSARGGTPVGSLVAPGLELLPVTGTAVVQATDDGRTVFAESGPVGIRERTAPGKLLTLRPGEFYGAGREAPGAVQPRPPADWLRRLPALFRDTIPLLRPSVQAAAAPQAAPLPRPGYDELAPWLTAEPALRGGFAKRFAAYARDPAFRAGLASHLAAHPEWKAVIEPRPRPSATP